MNTTLMVDKRTGRITIASEWVLMVNLWDYLGVELKLMISIKERKVLLSLSFTVQENLKDQSNHFDISTKKLMNSTLLVINLKSLLMSLSL